MKLPIRRLLEKVDFDRETKCWMWNGSVNWSNYGAIRVLGKTHLAHRLAYKLICGDIGRGLVIDHLCRRTRCINPGHMEVVTHLENVQRGTLSTKLRTHCRRGHLYSEIKPRRTINSKGHRNTDCTECRKLRRRAYESAYRNSGTIHVQKISA